mgnify:CR=1 FL=1
MHNGPGLEMDENGAETCKRAPLKQFDLQNHKIDLWRLMHGALGKIQKEPVT